MKLSFDRRGFLKKSSIAAMAAALGTEIAFADKLPKKYIPLIFDEKDALLGKNPAMIVKGDKPWNL